MTVVHSGRLQRKNSRRACAARSARHPVAILEEPVTVERREKVAELDKPHVRIGHEVVEGLHSLSLGEDGQLCKRP
jgi:hypothetical protein